MSPELAIPAAFLLAAALTALLTPVSVRVAVRTGFLDRPMGYKGHGAPTPYLGGTALMAGFLVAALCLGGGLGHYGAIVAMAAVLLVVGTVDDRLNLSPGLRVLIEVGVAAVLWLSGHGWSVFDFAPANLLLTELWVVGLVNAFNLMDNMDGACCSTAGASALGIGALAIASGRYTLGALCVGVAGACLGFLRHNLAAPARIFLGDGGSMPLGFLVAAASMAALSPSPLGLGVSTPLVGGLLAGTAILDTTLVSFSRRRGGRPLLSGGRDHLTHRLRTRLGSPRAVAATLATLQLGLGLTALLVSEAGPDWAMVAGAAAVAAALRIVFLLERPPWFTPASAPPVPLVSAAVVAEPLAGAVLASELTA